MISCGGSGFSLSGLRSGPLTCSELLATWQVIENGSRSSDSHQNGPNIFRVVRQDALNPDPSQVEINGSVAFITRTSRAASILRKGSLSRYGRPCRPLPKLLTSEAIVSGTANRVRLSHACHRGQEWDLNPCNLSNYTKSNRQAVPIAISGTCEPETSAGFSCHAPGRHGQWDPRRDACSEMRPRSAVIQ
jgi:hypothetical protein